MPKLHSHFTVKSKSSGRETLVDTTALETDLMVAAAQAAQEKHHTLGAWENYLGGSVRLSCCTVCQRHVWAQVLPNGKDDKGHQVYETDFHGPAVTIECGSRKVS
jgi:hypothetical protein